MRRGPWRTLLVGGICGAILGPLALVFTTGGVRAAAPRPAAADRPSVTFIGDSWTAGAGADGRRSYAVRAAEQLGWESTVLGVSGSGYDLPGRAGSTFAQRVDPAVATHADVIVVQGSLNERRSTPGSLRAAADDTLERLRAEADPDTRIVVLGASYVPGTPREVIDWINDEVRRAAGLAGVRFVDVAAEVWTDPREPWIWYDPIHPNDVGHQMIADRLVPILRAQVSG
jgi:lysophospholipase L1-like esterase